MKRLNKKLLHDVHTQNSNSGYTLIELIVSIQLLLIILSFVYTIYLFSQKFLIKWEEKNDLLNTELLIQKVFSKEISQSKKIIAISSDQIQYLSPQYAVKSINWSGDTLRINTSPINLSATKILMNDIKFLKLIESDLVLKSFADCDLNNNGKIDPEELTEIEAVRIDYIVKTKSEKKENFFIQSFNKNPDIF